CPGQEPRRLVPGFASALPCAADLRLATSLPRRAPRNARGRCAFHPLEDVTGRRPAFRGRPCPGTGVCAAPNGGRSPGRRPRRHPKGPAGEAMEDYEDGLEQVVPDAVPAPAPGGEVLDSLVRPALVAATRLFLVAAVALVVVDESGELRGVVAAGDLAQALEDAGPQLWSGPSLEVLASGTAVRTADLPGDGPWPARAGLPPMRGVNGLLCVPVEGPAGAAGTLTAVRRPDRPWQAREIDALVTYAGVVATLLRAAGDAERTAQLIGQLEHALHHRVVIEQAKGILMEREQLDPPGAFDRLRKAARARRRRVSDAPPGPSAPPQRPPRPRRRRVSEVATEVVAGQPLPPTGPNGNGSQPPA